ncbi:hypothetical protein HNY73_011721 [Argiope bruennichi]|uniref:Uncharacterized protein n=1 Tax=Argiope bruennichi TaxID=94029 RepID=A0A8T0F3R1_ARGBR|nr:hypothetical protein HNY73_011721 [Argiope bruennichi]
MWYQNLQYPTLASPHTLLSSHPSPCAVFSSTTFYLSLPYSLTNFPTALPVIILFPASSPLTTTVRTWPRPRLGPRPYRKTPTPVIVPLGSTPASLSSAHPLIPVGCLECLRPLAPLLGLRISLASSSFGWSRVIRALREPDRLHPAFY